MAHTNFNEALATNAEFLKPFAFTLTHDSEEAKDLYQETILRALVNKEKYDVGTNIKAWLYTIMRNIFINNYRRKATQKTIFENVPADYHINTSSPVITGNAISIINAKEIQKAVYSLPDILKKPFLFYFDGYKYHEIAYLLGEPLGTIKSRIHFARKLLKAQIERQ
jgi:RNA polymerase sigma-70 factor (ECF subfamily)